MASAEDRREAQHPAGAAVCDKESAVTREGEAHRRHELATWTASYSCRRTLTGPEPLHPAIRGVRDVQDAVDGVVADGPGLIQLVGAIELLERPYEPRVVGETPIRQPPQLRVPRGAPAEGAAGELGAMPRHERGLFGSLLLPNDRDFRLLLLGTPLLGPRDTPVACCIQRNGRLGRTVPLCRLRTRFRSLPARGRIHFGIVKGWSEIGVRSSRRHLRRQRRLQYRRSVLPSQPLAHRSLGLFHTALVRMLCCRRRVVPRVCAPPLLMIFAASRSDCRNRSPIRELPSTLGRPSTVQADGVIVCAATGLCHTLVPPTAAHSRWYFGGIRRGALITLPRTLRRPFRVARRMRCRCRHDWRLQRRRQRPLANDSVLQANQLVLASVSHEDQFSHLRDPADNPLR
mmetsp:Transcript_149863/g.481456  ORF Transcript_149863/g.481456 Transcript_149863/m.481456 type:complete len:402 (-) Transcript_149863:898-2103(-)